MDDVYMIYIPIFATGIKTKIHMKNALFPVSKNGKGGFINAKGDVIIDMIFESVSDFSEGLAQFWEGDKTGFIDSKGKVKIPAKFETVREFSEGLAAFSKGDKWGYIDTSGEVVIKPRFEECRSFVNGLAWVQKTMLSDYSFIDKSGETVLKGKDFMVSKLQDGLINCGTARGWGYIDVKGIS